MIGLKTNSSVYVYMQRKQMAMSNGSR